MNNGAWPLARGRRRRTESPHVSRRRTVRAKPRVSPALLISLALHASAVATFLLLRVGDPTVAEPDKPISVELVMVERRGEAKPPAPTSPPTPPAPPGPTPTPPAEATAEAARPDPAHAAEPSPPQPPAKAPVEARPEEAPETSRPPEPSEPAPARSRPEARAEAKPEPAEAAPPAVVPRIDLSGTDSPSDAMAQGERIIPASANAVFHNRPPEYPEAAARRGDRGVVDVIIRVSPAGTAMGADVVRSSGHALLDRAAREAVLTWRFLPAMKGGQPIPSDMAMRFIFDGP